jgi:Na+/H+-translocating membrane pyrophosphatase
MHRTLIFGLLASFVMVLPIWPYDLHWTYGPAIAVAFLLGVNAMVLAVDRFYRE